MANGLALGIQHTIFQSDEDARFHLSNKFLTCGRTLMGGPNFMQTRLAPAI
jgi:hypothetical protein